MVILGLVLLLVGWLVGLSLLYVLGAVLIVVGLVLWFVPVGGRTHRLY